MDGLNMHLLFPYPSPPFYRVGVRGELLASYVNDEGNLVVWTVTPAGQWSFIPTGPWYAVPAAMLQATEWMMNGWAPADGGQVVDSTALSSGAPLPQLNGGTGVFLPAPCRMTRPTVYETPNVPPMAPEEDVSHAAVGKKLELKAAAGKETIEHDMTKAGPSKVMMRQDHVNAGSRKEKQPKPQRKAKAAWRKKHPAMAAAQTEPVPEGKKKVVEEEETSAAAVDDFPELALLPEEWTY